MMESIEQIIISKFLQMGLFLTVYFTPTFSLLIGVGILVTVDFFVAIWKAKRLGIKRTSKRMRDTVGKSTAYFIAILVAHLFEVTFLPIAPIMQIIAFFIASAELKSIYESLSLITGLDFWTVIKERLSGNHKNSPDKFSEDE